MKTIEWNYLPELPTNEEIEYLCLIKRTTEKKDSFSTEILYFTKDLSDLDEFGLGEFEFMNRTEGSGFYDYNSEYGYCNADDVVAWIPIEIEGSVLNELKERDLI